MPTIIKINKDQFINAALCPLIFFFIALTIIGIGPEGPLLMQYDQIAVKEGQWWRILSAHFTHSTWNHFFLNMLGLGIMAVMFAQVATVFRWIAIMLFGSLFCSLGFFLFGADDYAYVGMSDVLHGVIIAFAFLDFKHFKFGNFILITGTLGKVIWEQTPYYVETSGEFIGGRVATESHFYGAISGLMMGLFFLWLEKHKQTANMSETSPSTVEPRS